MIKHIAILAAIGVTLYGFDVEVKKVRSCKAVVERFVMADFEEDYVCLSSDAKGNVVSDICTHYTKTQASHISSIITKDGVTAGKFMKDGMGYDFYPEISKDFTNHPHFVGYRRVEDIVITARYNDGTTHRKYDYLQCLLDRGNEFEVLTWFGMGGLHI